MRMGRRGRHRRVLRQHRPRDSYGGGGKKDSRPESPVLIRRLLKAPVIKKGIRTQTKKGTPQGGVLSPLLANIYLNEFDQYWYENWGKLTEKQRRLRREKGQASCVLFRYADDFIVNVKGTKEQAAVIMDSIRSFFAE